MAKPLGPKWNRQSPRISHPQHAWHWGRGAGDKVNISRWYRSSGGEQKLSICVSIRNISWFLYWFWYVSQSLLFHDFFIQFTSRLIITCIPSLSTRHFLCLKGVEVSFLHKRLHRMPHNRFFQPNPYVCIPLKQPLNPSLANLYTFGVSTSRVSV